MTIILVNGATVEADVHVANLLCGMTRPSTPKEARLVQELNHAIRHYESTFKRLAKEHTRINNIGYFDISHDGRVLIAAAWERYQRTYARISVRLHAVVVDHDRRNERRIDRQEQDDWQADVACMRAGY